MRTLLPLLVITVLLPGLLMAWPTEEETTFPSRGKIVPGLEPFDRLMHDFLTKHAIEGGSLAVARQGQVVYERSFGYANRETHQPVEPTSLFRIASISKPITAVAILQLAERGKLKLTDRIVDLLELAPVEGEKAHFDDRWKQVTVLQLLQHTGGWDRSKSFDPMFISPTICKTLEIPPPAGPAAIIRYMLHQPLQFEPGERYAYSNFGYCLLGRIIEKVTGKSYENHVRLEVLAPQGIQGLRLGRTLLKYRADNEVRYYTPGDQTGVAILGPDLGKPVPLPYGVWNLEAMDAHGGWIASAGDLVRFATAFDRPTACKILNADSIRQMFAPPPGKVGHRDDGSSKETFYGCGWQVRLMESGTFHSWHSGSLDGTSTLLVRRSDGLTWAVLFSNRPGRGKPEPSTLIDPLLHQAADAVQKWPSH